MEFARARSIISSSLETPLTNETAALLQELESLLETPVGEDEPSLTRLEDSLTAGYAHALALEAERWRLERRLGECAAELADREDHAGAHEELMSLARGLSAADASLGRLRGLLATLRERASSQRSAAAYSA
jgi:hypothetical protein